MAAKPPKATTAPEVIAQIAANDFDFEDAIADELLNNIDWQKVMISIIKKAPARLFAWLTTGSDRPINLSQFPELSALSSSEDQAK